MGSKDIPPPPGKAMSPVRRFWVRGRVQGVGFRRFVENEARVLGLTGWVRNAPDGRVEILACGPEMALGRLAERLRTGPKVARVHEVTCEAGDAVLLSGTFRIRYDDDA